MDWLFGDTEKQRKIMDEKTINIRKYSGELEPFSITKLQNSLYKSGASKKVVAKIIQKLQPQLFDGITTKIIYKKAFDLLKKHNHFCATRYSLKKAILDLGPTGFLFEKLVGEILKYKGFKTQVSVVLPGECVTHEIDVLAEKDDCTYAIECKFHSKLNYRSDVKVPLYINSRFLDIQKKWNNNPLKKTTLKQGWLVTNTKFTEDALSYAKCVGLSLFSWDYPKGNSIKDHIDRFGLYPVTALISLKKWEKSELMKKNIVLITELKNNIKFLETLKIPEKRIKKVVLELKTVCNQQ
jgi:hypothetical protein